MSIQIEKNIAEIKKSYDQPILFHMLLQHLMYQWKKTSPIYEITDGWSKILIFCCSENIIPNQGLELKIQSFIKRHRPPLESGENKLKLMILCYYLNNTPVNFLNHIVLFDLVNNFLGISDYYDGLILTLLSKVIIGRIYGLKENSKLTETSFNRMLEVVASKNFSNSNKVKSLICFKNFESSPPDLNFIEIRRSFIGFKYFEYICFYAKYTQNTQFKVVFCLLMNILLSLYLYICRIPLK